MKCINCGAELPSSAGSVVECEYCGCKQKNPIPKNSVTVEFYSDDGPYLTVKDNAWIDERAMYLENEVVSPNEIRKRNGLPPVMEHVKPARMPTKFSR